MSDFKKFDLSRVPRRTATAWLKKATKKGSKKIVVCLSHEEFTPHFVPPDANEEQKITEFSGYGERFPGVIDVKEALVELSVPQG
jgi:hypothetical protein